LKFIQSSEVSSYQQANWVVLPITGGKTLAYSKESSLGLPIVSSRIMGTQPCLNPKENFKGGKPTFWVGEMAWAVKGWTGCSPVVNDLSLDDRYTEVGISTNEYDLLSESGALRMMEAR